MNAKQFILFSIFLIISVSANVWQFFNVTEVEVEKTVYVEIPIEVPVEIPQTSTLEEYYVNGRVDVQFCDSFNFVDGTFEYADVWFMGPWDCHVTFRSCKIKNVTFTLTMLQVRLENCTVQNSYFREENQPPTVTLSGTSFTGSTTFNVNVVNGTGNTGLENVTFEGRVFQD